MEKKARQELDKHRRKLEGELGRQPTLHELSEEMDLPLRKIRIIRRAVKAFRIPAQAPVDENGDAMSLGDLLADERNGSPDECVLREDELRTIRRLLDAIDEREARILRLRFGLDGQEPLTLKQIAAEIGISRERVRQIADEALRKLNAQDLSENQQGLVKRLTTKAHAMSKDDPYEIASEDW